MFKELLILLLIIGVAYLWITNTTPSQALQNANIKLPDLKQAQQNATECYLNQSNCSG